jgi:hypothetical protein
LQSSLTIGQKGSNEAFFERRVSITAYNAVMEILRNLGEVINESESTEYMGAEYRHMQTRLWSNSVEMQRLFELMRGASNLNILMAVDNNLSNAERERDWLRGRLNFLDNAVNHPYVHIYLTETMPPRPDPPGFWPRIGTALSSSWNGFLTFIGHALVFLATASIPSILIAAGVFLLIHIIRRRVKARRAGMLLALEATLGENAALDGTVGAHSVRPLEGSEENET